ncbi:thiamine phosphate synthase [uncultured Acinetobacter sp.]|uniref:thiamine phosphate synthase n=1 Tax=uncultured Acinetobacter sp. TaxID=165433 RepID=UPI0025826ADE|nr:thiamine phosphate synthase [uncultured Acinetobacter sp.]
MFKPVVDVAIGILLHKNKVLVGWRQASQHQGNKHEFPGGKVETHEQPVDACRREIFEEVGVGLSDWHCFDVIRHEYDDVVVVLHLFSAYVPDTLLDLIQQPWSWYHREELQQLNFPAANHSILARLSWPNIIKISSTEIVPKKEELIYWRPEQTNSSEGVSLQFELDSHHYASYIVNIEHYLQLDPEQQNKIGSIHLKQSQLMQLSKGDLICGRRYIAACHDLVSIQQAHKIGCDAILISPVQATQTHPDQAPLGWERFEHLAQRSHLPVFALGGMHHSMLDLAKKHGAYGIAGIRNI